MKAENKKYLNLNYVYKTASTIMRSSLLRCACMALLLICITSIKALAQDGTVEADSAGIENTATNLFGIMYLQWRIPFTACGLVYGGLVALADEQRGIPRALKIIGITVGIALVPSIIKLIGTLTNTPA